MTTIAPVDAERARLAALRRYGILDTPREEILDNLVRLAARVLDTPIAALALVDAERVWFKAEFGLDGLEIPRQIALCNRAMASSSPTLEVPDAHDDYSLRDNPLLLPPIMLRFYAGAVLETPDGYRIGTLCVVDRKPRPELNDEQRATLVGLARAVMAELERRHQQLLREEAANRLVLLNGILAEVGGAVGFVPAIEAAMRRLCGGTGAAFAHLWEQEAPGRVRLVAFAGDPDVSPASRAEMFAGFPPLARQTDLCSLLAGDEPVLVPSVSPESVAGLPLMMASYQHGMRGFLLHKLPVGAARYALVLKFATVRNDLPEIAALVGDVAQAIRPALLRKQAEDRLALLNDVLTTIAAAPNFRAALEGAIALLCRHTGAFAGQFWDQADKGAPARIVALAGPGVLPPRLRRQAFGAYSVPVARSLLAPVLAAGGRLVLSDISPALASRFPLLRIAMRAGVRALAAQAFAVGDARFMLILGFDHAGRNLTPVADLLEEMSQAVRPAVLRKRAEDRLGLINAVLTSVAEAPDFTQAISAVLRRLSLETGALWALLWEKPGIADELRLVAVEGGPEASPSIQQDAAAVFPLPATQSLLSPLLEGDGTRLVSRLTDEMAERFPLVRIGRAAGMRSFAAQSLVVGPRRYVLCFTFATERPDLDQVADLMAEVARAIRPALQRRQAEDRLALLQAAVDATTDAVVVTDANTVAPNDRRVLLVNRAFTRMTSYPAEEAVGRNLRFMRGPQTDPTAVARLRAALSMQHAAREELLNYRRDGTPFWAELSVAPFADETGAVANWVGVLRDTSERRATHETLQSVTGQLRERTEQLAEVARLARIGFWAWRADRETMEWSEETFDLLGVPRHRPRPTLEAFLAVLHPEDAARAAAACRHAMQAGHDVHLELRALLAGGRTRSLLWSGSARRAADGVTVELRGYCQDVTEQREAEAALRHGEKLRALGKLTGGIAHEFSNLLTVVQANLEMALDESETLAEARPELEAARRAAYAGTELTGRLLSFARSQPLRNVPTDIAAWLGPLRDMAARTLGQSYQITLAATPDLPSLALDRSQMEGALLNLILNARDAMPMGGTIGIEAEAMPVPPGARGALADLQPGRYVAVTVRDGGAGMPPDVAERAFEPFFTTKPAGSGTGLGLSMVLSFARQSGGTALIETVPREGTAVRIVLPVA